MLPSFLMIDLSNVQAMEALAALLSFICSLLAAVWALELYQLLRTGAIGKSWRVFIAAALVFAFHEVVHIARMFNFLEVYGLYEATKFLFVALLAWGFYLQRDAFFSPQLFRAALNHRRHHHPPVRSFDELLSDDRSDREVTVTPVARPEERPA